MNTNKKIKKVVYYLDVAGFLDTADVFYEDGTKDEGIRNVTEVIAAFSIQEGEDYEILEKKGKLVNGIQINNQLEENNNTSDNQVEENNNTSDNQVEENNNTSDNHVEENNNIRDEQVVENNSSEREIVNQPLYNSKRKIKIRLAIGTVVLTGVIAALIAGSKFKLVRRSTPIVIKEPTRNEEQVEEYSTQVITQEVPQGDVISDSEIVSIIYDDGSANEVFNQNLNTTVERINEFVELGRRIGRGERVSLQELNDFCNRINSLIYSGITELGDYISNKTNETGSKYLISFQEFFEPGTVDYNVIKKMCDTHNSILQSPGNYHDRSLTSRQIQNFTDSLIDCIYDGKRYQGTSVYYNDLTPLAKLLLNCQLSSNFNIVDCTRSLNGKTMDRMDWIRQAVETLTDVREEVNIVNRRY